MFCTSNSDAGPKKTDCTTGCRNGARDALVRIGVVGTLEMVKEGLVAVCVLKLVHTVLLYASCVPFGLTGLNSSA